MIAKIFDMIPYFKNRKDLINDEFEAFLLTHDIPSEKYYSVKQFFETYLTDKEVRRIIEDEKYQLLGTECPTYTFDELKELGKTYMTNIKEYIQDNVNISRFIS
jgi:type I restriction enzyme R subunit